MMWGDGWGAGIAWVLLMLLFWGGLVILVVFLVRGFLVPPARRPGESGRPDPRDILAERFARGEISEDEFQERRRVLEREAS